MKTAVAAALTAIVAGALSCAPEPVRSEFTGTLDDVLSAADVPSVYERLRPAGRQDRARLESLQVSSRAEVFSGQWRLAPGVTQEVFLVEDGDARFVATDVDGDGELGDSESFPFKPLTDDEMFAAETTVVLPTGHARYARYPLKVRVPRGPGMPGDGSLRFLWRSVVVSLYGTVELGDREVRVRYDGFHPSSATLDPTRSGHGLDSDGDGEIPADPRSPEWVYPHEEQAVFRVGDQYVSTREVDLDSGIFTLESNEAAEYRRIELTIGGTIPDFDFVDFEGRRRSLSEFRGNPILLDFWGAWCGPCIADIPHLKEAWERYAPQGLQILGLDYDPSSRNPTPELLERGLERARSLVADHGIEWPQARTESILELIHERFRITSYPTLVLLDAEGKIVSAGARGDPPLRGEGLLETLEELFSETD